MDKTINEDICSWINLPLREQCINQLAQRKNSVCERETTFAGCIESECLKKSDFGFIGHPRLKHLSDLDQ